MTDVLEYTLSLNDKLSSKLQKIGVTSEKTLDIFARLEKQSLDVKKVMKATGNSVGALRAKLEHLKQERDWIPQKSIETIRKYNTEIKKLEKEIRKFETINGSKFKRNLKSAVNALPFSEIITNPVAQAGIAMFSAGKMALKFDEGMAKVNTTAQLSDEKLKELRNNLMDMGREAGVSLATVPDAYEKILSQTGDVALSQDILKASLKGSKAGFTDVNIVSGALAQSLSLIGKENANAQEVLDTFFAAKRVGAGEFQDFANYMPTLIASGKSLGVTYKQTAGLFAYMTGKGFKAEKSTMLLENAFSALSKSNIQKGLEKAGVSIFDKNGTLKDMGEIFSQLQSKLDGMTDKNKSNFLAKIGLVDKEARSAFMALSSDSNKLKEALQATAQSQGETEKAFEKAKNSMFNIQELWSNITYLSIKVGGVLSKLLIPVFSVLSVVVGGVADALSWLIDLFEDGNPIVVGLAYGIGFLTLAYQAHVLWTKRSIAIDKAKAISSKIVTGATKLWTMAQKGLNFVMNMSPIGKIILFVSALASAIMWVASKTEGWGEAWDHTIKGAKLTLKAFVLAGKLYYLSLFNAFMIGLDKMKIAWYKFKNAVGLGDEKENDAMIKKINADMEKRKKAITKAYDDLKKTTIKAKEEFNKAINSVHWKSQPGTSGSQSGISAPKKPGVLGSLLGNNDETTKNNEGKKTNQNIATGGRQTKYITINLKSLVEMIKVSGRDYKESAKNIEAETADAFLRLLAMASTTGS